MSSEIALVNKELKLTPLIQRVVHRLARIELELDNTYILRDQIEEDIVGDPETAYANIKRLELVSRRVDQLEKNFAIYADLIRKSSADEVKRRASSIETVHVDDLVSLVEELRQDVVTLAGGNIDRRFLTEKIIERFQEFEDALNSQ
jgi:hypothetical protein